MTPPLVIPPYLKEAPLAGLIGMGGGATSQRFYTSSDDAYKIEKSIRFNNADQGLINQTFAYSGDRRRWTMSCWLKRGLKNADTKFQVAGAVTPSETGLRVNSNQLQFYQYDHPSYTWRITSNALFRDSAAWYHIVGVYDSHQATDAERIRMYVNGERITSFSSSTYPSQYAESTVNSTVAHTIGKMNGQNSTTENTDGFISDTSFIDGLTLSPAAWGSFNTAKCWNPKAFALPSVNSNKTWSSMLSCAAGFGAAPYDAAAAFNGRAGYSPQSFATSAANQRSEANAMIFTPTGGLDINQSLEIWGGRNATSETVQVQIDMGGGYEPKISSTSGKWINVFEGKGTLTKVKVWQTAGSGGETEFGGVRVDGVVLMDGVDTSSTAKNNPNGGARWTNMASSTNIDGSYPWTNAFDGNTTGSYAQAAGATDGAGWARWTPTGGGVTVNNLLRINTDNGTTSAVKVLFSGGSVQHLTALTDGWNIVSGTGTLEYIEIENDGSTWSYLCGIEVDGNILLDHVQDNSYNLKYDDVKRFGLDKLRGKLADATGGKPLLATTDDYGLTLGSGNATDSFSSDLKFAFAGNDLQGSTLDISGSSHSCTMTNITYDSTHSHYYGRSLKFDGDGKIETPNHSDFDLSTTNWTVEFWSRPSVTSNQSALVSLGDNGDGSNGILIGYNSSGSLSCYGANTSAWDLFSGKNLGKERVGSWTHYAITRQGSTFRFFANGVQTDTATHAGDVAQTSNMFAIGVGQVDAVGSNAYIHGSIQDFRYYNHGSDAPKYTANFTVPWRHDFTDIGGLHGTTYTTTSDATGASPIYNTSDSYGLTKTSGYRSDSSAGTTSGTGLVLAVPGDSVAAGTCDVHQEINTGSSNKAISTTGGDPTVVTTSSHFYGSSIEFDGNDQISFTNSSDFDFGSGNFTIEAWVNTTDTSTSYPSIFGCWHTNTAKFDFRPRSSDQDGEFIWIHRISGSNTIIRGNQTVTDGRWHHIAVSRQGNVFRMFCDGKITNEEVHAHTLDDSSGMTINLGYDEWGGSYYTGKLNDLRVYKGVAKYTSDFIPPMSPGDNLDDSSIDSPTNYGTDNGAGGEVRGNYCIWNSIDNSASGAALTLAEANLAVKAGSASGMVLGTLAMPSGGKFYWEVTIPDHSATAGEVYAGIANRWEGGSTQYTTDYSVQLKTSGDPYFYTLGSTSNESVGAWTGGQTLGLAFDVDGGTLKYYRNGTLIFTHSSITTDFLWHPAMNCGTSASVYTYVNFGQKPFKYSAPSGYTCLCTANFDDTFSGDNANNPSKYFNVKTYTGTGSAQSILRAGFQPEFVWIKERSDTQNHQLYDVLRGTANNYKRLEIGATTEELKTDGVTTFDSDGFSIGGNVALNESPQTYVSWLWNAGASAVTPSSSYNITPTAQWASTDAGFSITAYTGNGSDDQTLPHELGAKPDFVIIKNRDSATGSWQAKHSKNSSGKVMFLDSPSAEGDSSYGEIGDLSSTVTVTLDDTGNNAANVNKNTENYIMYAWTAKPGFSAFGSYVGNDGNPGPFNYTGFAPRWVMIKNSTAGGSSYAKNWHIYDTARNSYSSMAVNQIENVLFANNSNGGYTYEGANDARPIDIVSNGFIIRESDSNINTAITYIWAAFAEHPLKTTRAR